MKSTILPPTSNISKNKIQDGSPNKHNQPECNHRPKRLFDKNIRRDHHRNYWRFRRRTWWHISRIKVAPLPTRQKNRTPGSKLGEDRMQTIYGGPAYKYLVPVDLGPYDTTIDGRASTMARFQAGVIHNCLNDNSLVYRGICNGTIKLIIYATGEDTVVPLRRWYIGFGNTTPQQMMEHLRTNMCVKTNIKEKEPFKTQGHAQEWDTSKNIITYFKEIENFKEKLDSGGITTSTAEMATSAVGRIYNISYFIED